MNLMTYLQQQATLRPQAIALVETRRGRSHSLTFAALESQIGQAATMLQQHGLQAGDRVLVFYPMSAALYVILGALFRLGLVALFLDPGSPRDRFEEGVALAQPQALITSPKAAALLLRSPQLRQIPRKWCVGCPCPGMLPWQAWVHYPPMTAIAPCEPTSPALLTFTSGSTGQPKVALRTHGFLLEQYRVLAQTLHLQPEVTELTALPLFVLANLAVGATTLIPPGNLRRPGRVAAAPIIRQIQSHAPQRLLASPAFLQQLVEYCQGRSLTLPSLQQILGGGAPMLPTLLHALRQIAPNATITVVYGSTEAEPIAQMQTAAIHPEDTQAMTQGQGVLVGEPIPEIQVQIVTMEQPLPTDCTAAEWAGLAVPRGQTGEIVVSGRHVLAGYWRGLGDATTKIRVEQTIWHRTGDAGWLDTAGRLWLLGRCQACFRDRHGWVYPLAVECGVDAQPGVRRSALVPYQGTRVLLIEPRSRQSLDIPAIQRAIAWAQVDAIHVLPHIPVDDRHNSKIAYAKLAQILARSPFPHIFHNCAEDRTPQQDSKITHYPLK